jgi:hypothetical protein
MFALRNLSDSMTNRDGGWCEYPDYFLEIPVIIPEFMTSLGEVACGSKGKFRHIYAKKSPVYFVVAETLLISFATSAKNYFIVILLRTFRD